VPSARCSTVESEVIAEESPATPTMQAVQDSWMGLATRQASGVCIFCAFVPSPSCFTSIPPKPLSSRCHGLHRCFRFVCFGQVNIGFLILQLPGQAPVGILKIQLPSEAGEKAEQRARRGQGRGQGGLVIECVSLGRQAPARRRTLTSSTLRETGGLQGLQPFARSIFLVYYSLYPRTTYPTSTRRPTHCPPRLRALYCNAL